MPVGIVASIWEGDAHLAGGGDIDWKRLRQGALRDPRDPGRAPGVDGMPSPPP